MAYKRKSPLIEKRLKFCWVQNIETRKSDKIWRGQVMLLSLAAGGVGLNLVGANHLFMLDMHWNPQMESQACDRIYRSA
jgi:hypothetical protein